MIDVEITQAIDTGRKEDDAILVRIANRAERWARTAMACREFKGMLSSEWAPMASDPPSYWRNWEGLLEAQLQAIEDAVMGRGVQSS
jgi:hypothetical protein